MVDRSEDIAAAAARIEAEFAGLSEWSQRIAHLMEIGRRQTRDCDDIRCEANLVKGCQSQVWLAIQHDTREDRLFMQVDSDALIMRGLLSILRRLYDGRRPDDILAFAPDLLNTLAVGHNLAPNRANGLRLVFNRLTQAAQTAQQQKRS
jgi:cysteine desulfuration protein SufE